VLGDELVLMVLGLLDAVTLGRLAAVSKACFAFALHENLWRTLLLTEFEADWKFQHNWRVRLARHTTTLRSLSHTHKRLHNRLTCIMPTSKAAFIDIQLLLFVCSMFFHVIRLVCETSRNHHARYAGHVLG
jgi:hypothetical protein